MKSENEMFDRDNMTNASRSTLFWAWDDRLEPDELKSQIKAFHDQHYGGFFMHSRDGLETAYMSKEWDEAILSCAQEAGKLGMEAWLYDEDRFPSGSCSGKVSADERYALHGLTLEVTETWPEDGKIEAAYIAQIDGERLRRFRRIREKCTKAADEKYLIVRFETSRGSVWFNGSAPPDNLNPQTVKRFIQLTHEHYKSLLQGINCVPGIFTDEPSIADRHAAFPPERSWMPWSYGMQEYYKEVTGKDIFDTFPLLFFTEKGSRKARFDYWRTIAKRFEECYSQTIGDWCHANGYQFTGHYLQEDKLGLQTRVSGSVMPHYRHEDIPGIDLLCERCDEYLTVKQCASVAHQTGKKRVLAETFAACGWDFTLTGQKWITDWEYVLGVTNKVEHLALYSLRGGRKRDYPASFSTHSPFFAMQHCMEDYSARLSMLLQQGEHLTRTLIIHPQTTVWSRFGCSPYGNPVRRNERDLRENDELGFRLSDLIRKLENALIDPDLGDETIIAQTGCAETDCFRIGCACYSDIILPWMENITEKVLRLLAEFNGRIIVLGDLPHLVDGEESTLAEKLLLKKAVFAAEESDVIRILSSDLLLDIEGKERGKLLTQTRRKGSETLFFIVNNDREKPFSGEIKLTERGLVSEYDLLTGSERPVSTPDMRWKLSLEKTGSKVFILNTEKKPLEERAEAVQETTCETITLARTVPVSLSTPNALTLDKAVFTLDGKKVCSGEELPLWLGEDSIRKSLGMFSVDTDEITQRYMWVNERHPSDGRTVTVTFCFSSEIELTGAKLAAETPERFTIELNGKPVSSEDEGWYMDKAFRVLSLPPIRKGKNILTLSTAYTLSSAIEAVYVIGDFAVTAGREIAEPVRMLDMGSWTRQGLYHYPGNVTYSFSFRKPGGRVIIQLPELSASTKSITINGHVIELPFDYQDKCDITPYIEENNSLDITLCGSLRNMLGQLHRKGGKPAFSNPYSFVPREEDYSPDYDVVDYGLMDAVKLIVLKT